MLPHDKALALGAVDTELLRDLRSRLNRPVSDKAAVVLFSAVFQITARVELTPLPADKTWATADPAAFKAAVAAASMAGLRAAVSGLTVLKGQPPLIVKALADGLPQAVFSRRLALAGREAPVEGASATP
jgi:hypothetical protein